MPRDSFAPVDPPEGQRELTVGHLRKALEGLPDDMAVGPTWTEIPPDEWPGIKLEAFGIETSGPEPTDRRFCFGIAAGALDDREFWGEEDDEDENTVTCSKCGKEVFDRDATSASGGGSICFRCLEDDDEGTEGS